MSIRKEQIRDFDMEVQGVIGGMVTDNVETGINVELVGDKLHFSVIPSSAGLPTPTAVGQVLFSGDGLSFQPATPVLDPDGVWMANESGQLIVEG